MATERKAESKLAEAAAKTTGVLQTLQSRLNRETAALAEDGPEELGIQLQEYFGASTGSPPSSAKSPARISNDLRELVIAGVVDRILRSWEDTGLLALKSEVAARLVEHVLAELSGKGRTAKNTH